VRRAEIESDRSEERTANAAATPKQQQVYIEYNTNFGCHGLTWGTREFDDFISEQENSFDLQ
jgi:hypothetical protein